VQTNQVLQKQKISYSCFTFFTGKRRAKVCFFIFCS